MEIVIGLTGLVVGLLPWLATRKKFKQDELTRHGENQPTISVVRTNLGWVVENHSNKAYKIHITYLDTVKNKLEGKFVDIGEVLMLYPKQSAEVQCMSLDYHWSRFGQSDRLWLRVGPMGWKCCSLPDVLEQPHWNLIFKA